MAAPQPEGDQFGVVFPEGIFILRDDGDDCTDDSCSLDNECAGCGVPVHEVSGAGTSCDAVPSCTFEGMCDGLSSEADGGCVGGTPIDQADCVDDEDCTSLAADSICINGSCACILGGVVSFGEDCWHTQCGRTKFNFLKHPIPADFFGSGSLQFDGAIGFGGGSGGFGFLVSRTPLDFTESATSEVAAASLIDGDLFSCNPITVDYSSGPSEGWNVTVGVSNSGGLLPCVCELVATKTHPNGGVFDLSVPLRPIFTFTRVDDSNDVRIFDAITEGISPMELTASNVPLVLGLSQGSAVSPCDTNFIPGVEEDPQTGEQNCRLILLTTAPDSPSFPGSTLEGFQPDCEFSAGACCRGNGSCTKIVKRFEGATNTPRFLCEAFGFTYKGDGTNCEDTDNDGLPDILEGGTGGGYLCSDRSLRPPDAAGKP